MICKPRVDTPAFHSAIDCSWHTTHLVGRIVKGKRVSITEPVLERDVGLAQIVLAQKDILSPYDELNDTEAIGEREIDREGEGRVLGRIGRAERALDDWGLVAIPEQRYDDESG